MIEKKHVFCESCKTKTNCGTKNFFKNHLKRFHKNIKSVKQYYDTYLKIGTNGSCQFCNKKLSANKFVSITSGYRKYCSIKCAKNNRKNIPVKIRKYDKAKAIAKYKKTCLLKYGVENISQLQSIKNKKKKAAIRKYGVENVFQSNIIKAKSKNSLLKKYGVDNPQKSKIIQNQTRKTNLQRYGHEYGLSANSIRQKIKNTCLEKYGVDTITKYQPIIKRTVETKRIKKIQELVDLLSPEYILKEFRDIFHVIIFCNNCEKEFVIQKQYLDDRIRRKHTICLHCNKINNGTSLMEKSLFDFIRKNYDGKIEENRKTIIPPQELDIYLPDLKLAFEFNGLYWHSEMHLPKNYHLQKTIDCEQKGIRLVHIFEDDWIQKSKIVQSHILLLLGKQKYTMHADDFGLCKIASSSCKTFLNENHIYGYVDSNINLALFKSGILYCVMSFDGGKLLRFCTKRDYKIEGSMRRMLQYFKRNYSFNITAEINYSGFADINLYKTSGFKFVSGPKLKAQYIIDNTRQPKKFKNTQSHKIYDSGYLKFKI